MTRDAATHIRALASERILVLDGSWGVLLQNRGLQEADFRGERFADHPRDLLNDPDLLNLTQPDVVRSVHESYFAAGADIATTNTFTATSIGQADYGLEDAVYDMNVAGARLAREAAGDRFVAGSVGPLNITLSLSPRVDEPGYRTHSFDAVVEAYKEQIRGLADVGVNCSLGAREMRPYVADLSQVAPCLTSCHPNAGLPNAFGGYDETPDVTSTLLREFAQDGLLNIAGSCCGSTPDHTRAIAEAVRGLEPRTPVTANLAQTRV